VPDTKQWTDQRIEGIIGTLLRTGVLSSALVVLAGGLVFLLRHGRQMPDYRTFRGEPGDLRSVAGVVHDALAFRGRGIIQLGLLLLILTPIARVAFSALAFALEKDRLYVVVTLIVLVLLILSLTGHVP
jgi:uncharacterized membrane protein